MRTCAINGRHLPGQEGFFAACCETRVCGRVSAGLKDAAEPLICQSTAVQPMAMDVRVRCSTAGTDDTSPP